MIITSWQSDSSIYASAIISSGKQLKAHQSTFSSSERPILLLILWKGQNKQTHIQLYFNITLSPPFFYLFQVIFMLSSVSSTIWILSWIQDSKIHFLYMWNSRDLKVLTFWSNWFFPELLFWSNLSFVFLEFVLKSMHKVTLLVGLRFIFYGLKVSSIDPIFCFILCSVVVSGFQFLGFEFWCIKISHLGKGLALYCWR